MAARAGSWRRQSASSLRPLLFPLMLLGLLALAPLAEAAFLGFGVDRVREFAGHVRT